MKWNYKPLLIARVITLILLCAGLTGNLSAQSWTNTSLSADQRAILLLQAMTFDEKSAIIAT
jgi:hypothetical protein